MTDTFEIFRRKAIYTQATFQVRMRSRAGLVYMLVGDKPVEMTTTEAHKRAFQMIRLARDAEPGELIIVKINGIELQFPPLSAKQIGGGLLRKADDADDFQLRVNQ